MPSANFTLLLHFSFSCEHKGTKCDMAWELCSCLLGMLAMFIHCWRGGFSAGM